MESITPLLYQSGYVTIKGYDEMFQIYTLDIPNAEVRIGLMRSLIPYYVTRDTQSTNTTAVSYTHLDVYKRQPFLMASMNLPMCTNS